MASAGPVPMPRGKGVRIVRGQIQQPLMPVVSHDSIFFHGGRIRRIIRVIVGVVTDIAIPEKIDHGHGFDDRLISQTFGYTPEGRQIFDAHLQIQPVCIIGTVPDIHAFNTPETLGQGKVFFDDVIISVWIANNTPRFLLDRLEQPGNELMAVRVFYIDACENARGGR